MIAIGGEGAESNVDHPPRHSNYKEVHMKQGYCFIPMFRKTYVEDNADNNDRRLLGLRKRE